jgi:hypothetical protein
MGSPTAREQARVQPVPAEGNGSLGVPAMAHAREAG